MAERPVALRPQFKIRNDQLLLIDCMDSSLFDCEMDQLCGSPSSSNDDAWSVYVVPNNNDWSVGVVAGARVFLGEGKSGDLDGWR
jgi:hypothetical protein